jgi:hypothetical protein
MMTSAVKFGLFAVALDAFLGFASRGVTTLTFFLTIVVSGFAQTHPRILQISSPLDGTVVHPGQTIAVTVVPTTGDPLTSVSIIGETPFGLAPAVTTPPYQFSITVPDPLTIRAGMYRLTAIGEMPGGRPFADSLPITIDVEPSAQVTSLSVEPQIVLLQHPTDGMSIGVIGTFSDGTTMRIDHSTAITYTAPATGDFTVTSTGVVRAGPMNRTITGTVMIQYGGLKASVLVNCHPAKI